jgi:hypothetical protein
MKNGTANNDIFGEITSNKLVSYGRNSHSTAAGQQPPTHTHKKGTVNQRAVKPSGLDKLPPARSNGVPLAQVERMIGARRRGMK